MANQNQSNNRDSIKKETSLNPSTILPLAFALLAIPALVSATKSESNGERIESEPDTSLRDADIQPVVLDHFTSSFLKDPSLQERTQFVLERLPQLGINASDLESMVSRCESEDSKKALLLILGAIAHESTTLNYAGYNCLSEFRTGIAPLVPILVHGQLHDDPEVMKVVSYTASEWIRYGVDLNNEQREQLIDVIVSGLERYPSRDFDRSVVMISNLGGIDYSDLLRTPFPPSDPDQRITYYEVLRESVISYSKPALAPPLAEDGGPQGDPALSQQAARAAVKILAHGDRGDFLYDCLNSYDRLVVRDSLMLIPQFKSVLQREKLVDALRELAFDNAFAVSDSLSADQQISHQELDDLMKVADTLFAIADQKTAEDVLLQASHLTSDTAIADFLIGSALIRQAETRMRGAELLKNVAFSGTPTVARAAAESLVAQPALSHQYLSLDDASEISRLFREESQVVRVELLSAFSRITRSLPEGQSEEAIELLKGLIEGFGESLLVGEIAREVSGSEIYPPSLRAFCFKVLPKTPDEPLRFLGGESFGQNAQPNVTHSFYDLQSELTARWIEAGVRSLSVFRRLSQNH